MEDLDPEDASHIVDSALDLMMEAVHRYEGFVARSTGDGIFALFGAPLAHEALRKELEAMRKKALAGALTDREFRALRDRRGVRPRCCPRLNRGKPHSHAGFRVQAPGLWAPRAESDRAGAP